MPKTPILERTAFYSQLPGGGNAGVQLLDWTVVETSIGTMVEPRQVTMLGLSPVTNVDVFDSGFTRISEINGDSFYSQYGTSGDQLPRDFNR